MRFVLAYQHIEVTLVELVIIIQDTVIPYQNVIQDNSWSIKNNYQSRCSLSPHIGLSCRTRRGFSLWPHNPRSCCEHFRHRSTMFLQIWKREMEVGIILWIYFFSPQFSICVYRDGFLGLDNIQWILHGYMNKCLTKYLCNWVNSN